MQTNDKLAGAGDVDRAGISANASLISPLGPVVPRLSTEALIVTPYIGTFAVTDEWLSDLHLSVIDAIVLRDNPDSISAVMVAKYVDGTIRCEQIGECLRNIKEQAGKEIVSLYLSFDYISKSELNEKIYNMLSLEIISNGRCITNAAFFGKNGLNILGDVNSSITLFCNSSFLFRDEIYNNIVKQISAITRPPSEMLKTARIMAFIYAPAVVLFALPLLLHLQIGVTKHANFDKSFDSMRNSDAVGSSHDSVSDDIMNKIDLLIASPYHADLTNNDKLHISILFISLIVLIVSSLVGVLRRRKSAILCTPYAKQNFERQARIDKLTKTGLICMITFSFMVASYSIIYLNSIAIILR